jgi:pimeloyl-ACP methyl ester carboxylesterase
MALRPQTLYALEDSPIGLAAWMLDHDAASLALIARVFAGESAGLTKDDICDNVALYWLTGTAISSARLYWDNALTATAGFFDAKHVELPVSVTVFPDEIYAAPQSWAERAYSTLIQYVRHQVGGHFAAWEQPQVLAEDLRDAFRTLR